MVLGFPKDLKEGFLELFFPGPTCCPLCGELLIPAEDIPCPSCRRQVLRVAAPLCPRCGKPLAQDGYCPYCYGRNLVFIQARAAAIYTGVLRRAIHLFKYKGVRELLPYLEGLLGQCLSEHPPPVPDVIIPVPLHRRRERERGFNQAALLAAGVGRHLQRPVDYHSLIRRQYTPPTHGLSRREREKVMKDAFICRAGRRLRGKTILLIDDILTTGATASGCSTALLQGGAAGVYVLTVATVAGYK